MAKLRLLRRPPVVPPTVVVEPPPVAPVVIEPPPAVTPPPPVEPPQIKPLDPYSDKTNRKTRRRLERLRRKHDKFVTPQGPQPVKLERRPTQQLTPKPKPAPEPEPVAVLDDPNDFTVADEHHDDRGGADVLYEETEMYGEFNFRDTILQQLERYFVYIERMKKHDPDAYGFYKKIGAQILPYAASGVVDRNATNKPDPKTFRDVKLPDWFNRKRPGFGCFVYGADPETEKYELNALPDSQKRRPWVPKFMYYQKYKAPPPEMQPLSGGDTYSLTIWWDRPHDKKWSDKEKHGRPQNFGVFISADGKQVTPLRVIDTVYVPVKEKRKNNTFHIPKRAWHLPSEFERWAKNAGEDPHKFLANLFCMAVEKQEHAHYSMVRVAATKGDTTAVFSVNVRRMSYFFQDRDITLTEGGQRKRVFHMVRSHVRKDGRAVKIYFRGEREFTWAGYQVSITIPGRDHFMMDDINLGVEDEYWWDKEEDDYVTLPEMGDRLVGLMKQGIK